MESGTNSVSSDVDPYMQGLAFKEAEHNEQLSELRKQVQ